MSPARITTRLHQSLSAISAADWDACACPETADTGFPFDPFTTHRFLLALEESGSVGEGTGWQPYYLSAYAGRELIAVAPLFAKSHSQGEYVFDMSWADAYERAGGHYYPKLQIAVPFTPVPGRRLLTRPGFEVSGRAALIESAIDLAAENSLSSLHITFCTDDEAATGEKLGLMRRIGQQYHWQNQGYADFDGFLADLSARKRKNIRRERSIAQGFGGEIINLSGDEIETEHMQAFWHFYQDTGARKWGSPYLTRAFFDLAQERLRKDMALVLARRDGHWIAGALSFVGRDALFGRYWGASEHHSCLHFELCFYQAIDLAISQGLERIEAGAQGEHKIARGYRPVQTNSLHWIAEPGFRDAVSEFLRAEAPAVGEDIEILTAMGPFRSTE
ncbi:MAG: N-acetyltransferase [Rhodobacteraceae bacterium]|nr:N-acetyltransferase [Paracoccaceae bacterium]